MTNKKIDYFKINYMEHEFSYPSEIILIIAEYLDIKSLCYLMQINTYHFNAISNSKLWRKFINRKFINRNNYYKNKCSCILNNPILQKNPWNNIPNNDKYGESYYFFRYHNIRFDGYLRLNNLLQCTDENLGKFRTILRDYFKDYDIIEKYNYLLKSVKKLKGYLKKLNIEYEVFKYILFSYINYSFSNPIILYEGDHISLNYDYINGSFMCDKNIQNTSFNDAIKMIKLTI